MVTRLGLAVLVLLLIGPVASAQAAPAGCRERLLPPIPGAATGQRPITGRDLIELRDFGRLDTGAAGAPVFSISPDGRFAAIALRRAEVRTNLYCFGIALVRLDGSAPVRLVDVGGAFIPSLNDIRGVPAIPNGTPVALAPLWSHDGRALFYLRRDHGLTRLWRATPDGTAGRAVTALSTDILSVEQAGDGRTLLLATRPSLAAAREAIDREGRNGFHFDARFWTVSEARPRPALPLPLTFSAFDPDRMTVRTLSPAQAEALRSRGAQDRPRGAVLFASGGQGRAWTVPDDPRRFLSPARLHVEVGGRALGCPDALCGRGIGGIWWVGDMLIILRGGGPEDQGRLSLYSWRVGTERAPQLRFSSDAALLGCALQGAALLCARETATEPRHLARIALADGQVTRIFDPNPEFAQVALGSVARLAWTDGRGARTYGDLVLPRFHRSGERRPLIVVQYQSRGFLRGGTGDEYPIHLLAEQGFAVLSFQQPARLAATDAAPDLNSLQRINIAEWAGRRAILAALHAGIDAAIARGAVDPARIGLTGMSDGATTTQFALNTSQRFRAAAISSCCDEPSGLFAIGPAYRDALLAWGYPRQSSDDGEFWKPMSLSRNAPAMSTPLLIQVPDAEYRGALEAVSALEQHGAPVEMYVFPDEHHVKAQPAHRSAIYQRAIDWFGFWLMDRRPARGTRDAEVARWEQMKAAARP
ncbi:Atxe2 family lasso peptide isopeptidase [Sphingomonas sp. R647]|uniref:Atxe2 family lasso peptide isopeptidase n=1 Tax=Sphingomonas sp. R647 TaxID=2875233 RepID=UPI001CD6B6F0|nr:Atxe2 family lasso peptide isopeptidase [Sphingomonas sp. R647]MCA1196497.1 Atxe2 family lasso peptide isopeptidase [Sphingomonas sp. R647]